MFKNAFLFEGRIRRTEYGLSFIIFVVGRVLAGVLAVLINGVDNPNMEGITILTLLFTIPLLWFFFAQGAKRAHDTGISGWWQLVPFAPLYLVFAPGQEEENKYGSNPKSHLQTEDF